MSSDHSLFKVSKKNFNKTIQVPSSKSYANRLLILAAISREDVCVENLPLSSDVTAMITCLRKVGLGIELEGSNVWVRGSFPECEAPGPHILETGDGGTTNRFLCSLLAKGRQKYILRAKGHMLERQMTPLLDALISLGVGTTYKEKDEWITIQGPMNEATSVEVDATETTQFITSLALALADSKTVIKPLNLNISLPYWRLTQNLIQKYQKSELRFYNPVDFSSLTYPLALAAVTGSVTISNCFETDENQADSVFINLLKQVGASIEWSSKGLKLEKGSLRPIDFDGSQCPDAIPTLLFVCSFCNGTSRIKNLEVLTHKECDRFVEMIRMLDSFGVDTKVDYENFEITINGPVSLKSSVDFVPPKDHRMVMVAYLFQRSLSGGTLSNSDHVSKSFANFFEVMD
jgi:3-phosphoshikimate 1-carboxyvinyltransferase